MSSTREPGHLNNHHRNTLRQLFQHPVSHNIEWIAVVSLLGAVGSVAEQPHGKLAVTIGPQTEYFDPPARKDIDTQAVVDLRRMLSAAGYGLLTGQDGRSLAGLMSPRPSAHPQGSQGKSAEEHDDSDDQQVQQALDDHADDTQRDRHDY